MKVYPLILVLLLVPAVQAADFGQGMAAYERGDYDTALQQMMQLAEAGDPDAQFVLGRMFARGAGVVQDFVEAHKWYNLAASRGQRMAPAARDAIAAQMSPEQLAAAQDLARDWRPLGRDTASAAPESPPVVENTEPPSAEPQPSAAEEEPTESTIARIQLELKRLGYDIGFVDGRLGPQTQAAIRDFQSGNDLPVDGQPSAALLEKLSATRGPRPPIQRAPEQPSEQNSWRRLM